MMKCKTFGGLLLLTLWLTLWLTGAAQNRSFTIQTASMPTETEARAELAKLAAAGLAAHFVKANVPGKGVRYRIRVGRFNSMAEAQTRAEQAVKSGKFSEFIVTVYEPPTETVTARREPATGEKAANPKLAENKSAKEVAKEPGNEPAPSTEKPAGKRTSGEALSSSTTGEKPGAPKTEKAKTEKSKTEKPKERDLAHTETAKPASPEATTAAAGSKSQPSAEPSDKHKTEPHEGSGAKAAEAQPAATTENANKPEHKAENPPHPAEATKSDPAATTHAAGPDKVSPAPRIAQPPLADALGELDISNRNWKIVRRSTATDKNLRAIFFVDSMTGWAAGDAGAIYRTTDGGKAWKPLLSGAAANINQIFFVDWNNGWMLGELTRRDNDEPETVILSTTNGGRSWQKKSLPGIQRIFFTSPQIGWAVGKNATILRTEDGGHEWKATGDLEKLIGLPVESSNYNFGFRDIYFLDAQNGWLIGNFYGREKSHIGGIFFTNDGGTTWKRLPITVQTKYSSGRFTPGVLHAIHFKDVNTGSVTGEMLDGEGRFFFALHTRDGGKSWEQYRTPSRATHSTQFLDSTVGWTAAAAPREGGADAVVYDTTLMRTDNGGASWQYDFVAKGSRIRGVFFLNQTKGWAVGDRGMILRYEDRSKTN